MSTPKTFRERMADTEKKLAISYLAKTGGAFMAAARRAHLHPSVFRRIVKRHGLQNYLRKVIQTAPRGGNDAWRQLGDA